MHQKNKEEELEKIITESRKFREKCKSNIEISKQLCGASDMLINEIQTLQEDTAVLLEEKIVIKEEMLAILEIATDGKELSKDNPLYFAVRDEIEILKQKYNKLYETHIRETNLPLLKLRDEFFSLTFLKYK